MIGITSSDSKKEGDCLMALTISKAQVWAGDIEDRPGGLANLLEPLGKAGVDLEFLIARRQAEKPGQGVVFLTPIKGKKGQDASRAAGLVPTKTIGTLRIEGANRAGAGAKIARALADAGVNVRGVSAATFGKQFVAYLGFDGAGDADKAAKALRKMK
jgi:hypothetical protein